MGGHRDTEAPFDFARDKPGKVGGLQRQRRSRRKARM